MGWISTWLLMVVAMMWPLTVPTVGAIARSSFRGWRNRLGAVCLATVTILWLAVGLAGALLAQALSVPSGSFAWQLTFIALALVAYRFGAAQQATGDLPAAARLGAGRSTWGGDRGRGRAS